MRLASRETQPTAPGDAPLSLHVGQTRCDYTSLDNSLVAGRIFYGTLH